VTSTTKDPADRVQPKHEPAGPDRRMWWLVPALALITAIAAFAWSQANPRDWSASAEVLVTAIGSDETTFLGVPALRQSGDTARTVQTAAAVVDSVEASRRAAQRLGRGWSDQRVRDRTSVQVRGASTVLAVTATTDERADAARVANALAESALAVRREALVEPLEAAISQTLSQLRRHRGDPSDYADRLRSKLDALRIAQQTGDPTLSLAEAAAVPERTGVPTWLLTLAGLLAGAALGVAALLLIDALRQGAQRP